MQIRIISNHDLEILPNGTIRLAFGSVTDLSDKGHLSNDDSALAMCEMMVTARNEFI